MPDRNNTGIQQQPGRRQQMINSSLQAFASNVQKAGRISFGDVKRLQRDILPDAISSRAEAELLLTLDQSISRADRAFADWLLAMMVDFVVWGVRTTGSVEAETAAWLTPFLVGQRATKTMLRLARELASEAEQGGIALCHSPIDKSLVLPVRDVTSALSNASCLSSFENWLEAARLSRSGVLSRAAAGSPAQPTLNRLGP